MTIARSWLIRENVCLSMHLLGFTILKRRGDSRNGLRLWSINTIGKIWWNDTFTTNISSNSISRKQLYKTGSGHANAKKRKTRSLNPFSEPTKPSNQFSTIDKYISKPHNSFNKLSIKNTRLRRWPEPNGLSKSITSLGSSAIATTWASVGSSCRGGLSSRGAS